MVYRGIFSFIAPLTLLMMIFFKDSNACFHNMLKMIKSTTKGIVKHYPEIEPEDLLKLYKSFNTETPRGLLEKVWLDIIVFLSVEDVRTCGK